MKTKEWRGIEILFLSVLAFKVFLCHVFLQVQLCCWCTASRERFMLVKS